MSVSSRAYGQSMQRLGLPLMLVPTRSQMTSLAGQMRRHQFLSLDEQQDLQLNRVRQLVRIANEGSQFYGERYSTHNVDASSLLNLNALRQFPITTKQDLEVHFPDGIVVMDRRSDDWQYVGTRGTTKRVIVVHDFERRDISRAADMIALTEDGPYKYGCRQVSIPPDACSVHCGVESNRVESVLRQLLHMATGRIKVNREAVSDLRGLVMDNWICPDHSMPPLYLDGTDESLEYCSAILRKMRPIQLKALPEYLLALAEYQAKVGDALPPIPVIRPIGANFPGSWKNKIESAFRGKLREHYGSREMSAMAFDCKHQAGLHVLTDKCIIEVVRDGQVVADGEIGKVLVTDLCNFAMPLIRYDIGDLARITHAPCKCGRQSPRLTMEGRVQDALLLSDGRILSAEAISNFFADQAEVVDFELTEAKSGKLTLRVVPADIENFDADKLARRFLDWAQLSSRKISVRTSKMIRPEESGKYRHVRSSSFEGISAT